LKKIILLIIASLLVIGLVLPGCAGEGPEPPTDVIYTFEDQEIVVGIAGEVGHATGDMQYLGATLAATVINGGGGVVIDGVAHDIVLEIIDTQEATDETGWSGLSDLAGEKYPSGRPHGQPSHLWTTAKAISY